MKKILSTIGVVSGCLVFSAIHSQVQAQTRTITGTVNNGEKPISGVVITQEGTHHLTTTTATGTFSLQITGENPVLIFRHPEYSERKLNTDGKTTFNISLTEKVKTIEEVVLNAGYYNVKAKESTGSISKVTAKDIENQPVNNVLSAVQGRMAGVSITQNSGVPGGGFDVQIRGRNSLRTNAIGGYNANTPLYVIDGIPVPAGNDFKFGMSAAILPSQETNPLNVINPNDIESIEVLKDADATAIYGSRGANGVVLVTTKRGKKGRIAVVLNVAQGLSDVGKMPKMMTTEQYIALRKQAFANDGITQYPVNAYDINGTWDINRYTDWQNYMVGGYAEQNNTRLNIQGGSESTQFSINAGHDEQGTVFPGNYKYKRNTVGVNLSHQSADKKLKLNFSSYYTTQNNLLPPTDFSRVYSSLTPNAPALYTSLGVLNWEKSTFTNPMAAATQRYKSTAKQLMATINITYQIGEGLELKLNSGYTDAQSKENQLFPKTFYDPANNIGSDKSALRLGNTLQNSWILEPQFNWDKKWGEHHVQALVGGTFQEQTGEGTAIYASNFPSDEMIENIGSAANIVVSSSDNFVYKYMSVYGRLNYQYKGRYIVNVTSRRDGSSRFGPNNKFGNFGAIGAAWLFDDEIFLEEVKWLSTGKLRGSYGSVGSDLIGNYQYYDTYENTGISYDGVPGMTPSRLYNPNFSWEVTRKLELGIDLGFFEDRLTTSVGWYRNRSSSQLVGIPLPMSTGFSSIQANLNAIVENRGWEFTLQSENVKKINFKWTTSLNLSIPKNTLIDFPNLRGSTYANTFAIGQSTTMKKLYHYLGVDPITGIYRFEDVNGDGKLDINDRTVIKNIGVQWFGGLQNSLDYKSWNLQLLMQVSKQTRENILSSVANLGTMGNYPAIFTDYWTPEHTNATYQQPTSGNKSTLTTANANFRLSDATVDDSYYIRVKNVSVKYLLPELGNSKLKASVYLEGQNLWTWTNYKGTDPEFNTLGYTPMLRVWSFGINLNF